MKFRSRFLLTLLLRYSKNMSVFLIGSALSDTAGHPVGSSSGWLFCGLECNLYINSTDKPIQFKGAMGKFSN